MSTTQKPKIGPMIVLQCDHAGLQPMFQRLEDEMRRVIGQLEDAREVKLYLTELRQASILWSTVEHGDKPKK